MKNFIKIQAILENWGKFYLILSEFLGKNNINKNIKSQIFIACEEIFVNISKYAYKKNVDNYIFTNFSYNNKEIKIIFIDNGIPFDPTKIKEPELKSNALNRKIGGLGIFLTKKLTNYIKYNYIKNQNILLLIKRTEN